MKYYYMNKILKTGLIVILLILIFPIASCQKYPNAKSPGDKSTKTGVEYDD